MTDPGGITNDISYDTETYACKGLMSVVMGLIVQVMLVSTLILVEDNGGPVQKGEE